MTQPNYPGAPSGGEVKDWTSLRNWITAAIATINRINTGKTNNTGELTLTAGATSTAIVDSRATPFSHIDLTPLSLASAGALATTFPSTRTKGGFTLTHANTTDVKLFTYSLTG